jgi:prepilin-type N-terminal cleavage/methylation domain-containing protein
VVRRNVLLNQLFAIETKGQKNMNEQSNLNVLQRMVAKRNEGGFTLIELLIVIIILAILAAIVVFAVGSTNTNAIASSCNADAKSVETAMEAYRAQVGSYPAPASASSVLLTSQNVSVNGVNETVGPWLKEWPSTNNYTISVDTAGNVLVNNNTFTGAQTDPCNSL